ncbi:hypothetical protein ACFOLJ_25480 [Rugamonas sp. CCM 8940]|uniref:hypothetical protein n=1 Tax=Rugamonas sp. CCM 8940 TaxID=2765359 RepID=UPI0018F61AE6|nr:hypothetical protein [Rugamonas sp. CCM 8940]MBJ7310914.1 hypothetical protein [Rugamonas sp. CCM 8940]
MSYNLTPAAKSVLASIAHGSAQTDMTIAAELTSTGLATDHAGVLTITEAGRTELARINDDE